MLRASSVWRKLLSTLLGRYSHLRNDPVCLCRIDYLVNEESDVEIGAVFSMVVGTEGTLVKSR